MVRLYIPLYVQRHKKSALIYLSIYTDIMIEVDLEVDSLQSRCQFEN